MGTSVHAPPPRNYGQETRDSLRAQVDLAPELLRAEQETRGGYTKLDLEGLDQTLYGLDGQRGLVDIYGELTPQIGAIERQGASDQRASDINDVQNLGPKVQEALRSANPEQWRLIDELNRQAQEELAAGRSLTPSMRSEIQQYVRAGQSARGLGAGPSDLYEEAFTLGQAGQQMQDRRRAFATSQVGLNQQISADPFLAILSRPSNSLGSASGVAGQGGSILSGVGPRIFNPESQYAADIYGNNYQAELAARTASASNKTALIGAGIAAAGSIAGSF